MLEGVQRLVNFCEKWNKVPRTERHLKTTCLYSTTIYNHPFEREGVFPTTFLTY
jgi:hypothetical protein